MGAVEMQKTIEVDGESYTVLHPSPTACWEIGVQLMQIVGEPFASMAQVGDDQNAAGRILPMAIKSLMSNVKPKETLEIIKRVLSTVQIDEQKVLIDSKVFELHFRGRVGHMLKVVSASVEYQYGDFFGAIGDALAAVFKKAAGASQSQSTSAGQS